ncbi:MAG: DUF1285 domain-containing protein [Chitinophagales bacterium]
MLLKEIRIKRDGKWYANDAEMFRKPILNLFANHLQRDEEGNYRIELNNETFPVIVDDVPFKAEIAAIKDSSIVFICHDQQEILINRTIPIFFKGETPYISYRWENDTRLGRSAFWMVSNHLVEKEGQVFLVPPSEKQDGWSE